MHLKRVDLYPEKFPTQEQYPFNLDIFHQTPAIEFSAGVTFFVGENGSGKTTLLQAIAKRCGIHIWRGVKRTRFERNPYEDKLYRAIEVEWADGPVFGSFFSSELFQNFSRMLDEWAAASPALLDYFGGKSLLTQSHGQSLMSFFDARYRRKGIYFADEPETALSPKTQLSLLKLLEELGREEEAQFIIATHSPILLSCPGATIYSFDSTPIKEVTYKETAHYRIYRDFMADQEGEMRS